MGPDHQQQQRAAPNLPQARDFLKGASLISPLSGGSG
jgi:hypothetical protein